eukprot:4217904-Alexandrium_andersonii.AAC.1
MCGQVAFPWSCIHVDCRNGSCSGIALVFAFGPLAFCLTGLLSGGRIPMRQLPRQTAVGNSLMAALAT